MKNKSCLLGLLDEKAFTLIELLVVVLIIGILAAVALPQYTKAVEKSKATQALIAMHSLIQAQEAHYLASGTYATKFDELDLELPWTGTETWAAGIVDDTRSNPEWSLQIWNGGSGQAANNSGIYMGRLTGKYKGGGFMYYFKNTTSAPNNVILCAERTGNGLAYEGTAGSYCKSIFKGTKLEGGIGVRMYTMP